MNSSIWPSWCEPWRLDYAISFCLFAWFDSLRPINNLSVKQGRVFLGWTSTKLGSRTTTLVWSMAAGLCDKYQNCTCWPNFLNMHAQLSIRVRCLGIWSVSKLTSILVVYYCYRKCYGDTAYMNGHTWGFDGRIYYKYHTDLSLTIS